MYAIDLEITFLICPWGLQHLVFGLYVPNIPLPETNYVASMDYDMLPRDSIPYRK